MKKRYLLLDALRGLAVLLMLVFHLAVDLEDFFGFAVGYRHGGWKVLNYIIVLLFLLISGYAAGAGLNRHSLKNGVKLFAAAILVTAATYFFDSASYVRFGILHLLACAMLLTPFFLARSSAFLAFLAVIFLVLGYFATFFSVQTNLLLPFGIMPETFYSIDYYPLLPWLAIFICGILLGRRVELPLLEEGSVIWEGLAFLGRQALFIYLIHQPLFLLFLTLLLG